MIELDAAKRLVVHIRQCFLCLFDGLSVQPRKSMHYWLSLLSHSPMYWDYPIITEPVLNDCYTLEIDISRIKKKVGVYKLIALLNSIEEPLKNILNTTVANDCKIKINTNFQRSLYTSPKVNKLQSIFITLQKESLPGLSLYLHGSMADHSYTAFSDVDDFVVVRSELWKDAELLIDTASLLTKLAREYQSIDPLQHHGHWVITEFDLMCYDQGYLPMDVLKGSVRVIGDSQIRYCASLDYSRFIENAKITIQSIEKRLGSAEFKGGLNAFELKCLVGEISILPAYIFQAFGNILSKPEAIDRSNEIFSDAAIKAIEWTSEIRKGFTPFVNNRRTKALKIIARMICCRRHLSEWLFKKCSSWVDNKRPMGLSPIIIQGIRTFTEESIDLIRSVEK